MKRKRISDINAGSMADIAFLLLIFFLVTTTMDVDKGIFRKIAEKQTHPTNIKLHDRNVFDVNINKNNEIWISDRVVAANEIQKMTLEFIDNGGGKDIDGNSCDWCSGTKKSNLSDHPSKAFITIAADRDASYETYVMVLDQVNAAYATLRNQLAYKMYGKNYHVLEEEFRKTRNPKVLDKIKTVRTKYPLLIGDLETTTNMAQR